MALISLGYDTKYVDYLMKEMKASELDGKILKLYTIIFCVHFMSEKGMKFKDKVVEVNANQVKRLNEIFEEMYSEVVVNF